MEQGNRLDSAPVSARQEARGASTREPALDAAVTALLAQQTPEAPERRTLIAYASWLYMERQFVCHELYPHLGSQASSFVAAQNAGFEFHRRETPPATTRAASVLALVGCDWSQDRDLGIGDGGGSFPNAKAFPHPDARLIDLEQEYLAAQASYVSTYSRETEARAEFARREEPYREADQGLLLHYAPRAVHWEGVYLRRVLADRFSVASAFDASVINNLRRDQLEALLKPVEARDARREALATELRLDELEAERESALDAREDLARKIYRLPAATLDGLALKARVLKINNSDLWTRPNWQGRVSAEWHEIALTEIAGSVEYLINTGRQKGADEVHGGANVLLSEMTGGVYFEDSGTVSYTDANGKVLRTPVADWIAYTAMRLHFVARTELARQVSDHNLSPEERQALDRSLRRDLRIDAIHGLAFRPAEAFHQADNDRRFGYDDQPPPPVWAKGKVSVSLLQAIEAHRSAVQIEMHDPVQGQERHVAAHERIRDLAEVIRAYPVRSPEDLRHKLIYLWPGPLDDHIPDEGIRRTISVLRDDFMRLVDRPSAPLTDDDCLTTSHLANVDEQP